MNKVLMLDGTVDQYVIKEDQYKLLEKSLENVIHEDLKVS